MADALNASFIKRFPKGAVIRGELVTPASGHTVTVLFGPSGCGKTTVLRCLAGLERPEEGAIRFGDQTWFDAASGAWLTPQQRDIGFVFQDYALFPHLSVADNIAYGLSALSASEREARVQEIADRFELAKNLRQPPRQLSGGQQQRVALARALAQRPHLMLLDEPFSALDTGLRASTRKSVARVLGAAGVTTILVTHDQEEALSFADQVAVMRNGRLPQVGEPRDVYLRPHDRMIAEFLGEAIVMTAEIADGWADCALGRIPVDQRDRRGSAQIMLRPEHMAMTLAPAVNDATDATEGAIGEVTDIDFGGATCSLALRLLHSDPALKRPAPLDRPLILRTSGVKAPPLGARVRIRVVGEAHILADPDEAPTSSA